ALPIVGEPWIARDPVGGADIGELDPRALGFEPVDLALFVGHVDALDRIVLVGGVPADGPGPGCKRGERQHERDARGDFQITEDHALMWSTQIRVNRRRDVSKSSAILPSRLSFNSVAASLWMPRRAMSIVSIWPGVASRSAR